MPQATARLMPSRLPSPLHQVLASLPLWLMWFLPGRLQARASTSLMQVSGCAQEKPQMGGCAVAGQCPVVRCAQGVPALRHRSAPMALYGQAQWNLETLVSAGTICYPLLSALDCCSTLLQSMGLEAPKPTQSDQAALLKNNLGCPSWPLVRHAYPYQACLLPCLVPAACRLSCRAGTQCPASAALTH